MRKVVCHSCGNSFDYDNVLSRNEECRKCGLDLKVCLNCRFFNEGAKNQCTEPQAEPVGIKDKANYCDYFEPSEAGGKSKALSGRELAKQKLDSLFKK